MCNFMIKTNARRTASNRQGGSVTLFLDLRGWTFLLYDYGYSAYLDGHGHFLLQARTGTCYTHHQAIVVQRRMDRIRRATAEEHSPVQVPPPPDTSPQIQPATPPPWQMEPPPSYETVMKTTTAVNQL
ncbi:hypothetical protein QQF64_016771 [Cirrhinus molitorella]|uniref:Uncharacterized protein n=1 Tax=Cirrhinus molitorella TaxID=172907 RepID=A0ABR3LNU8_9TELE